MNQYVEAAAAGDATAMCRLGQSYLIGADGVNKDDGEALRWYRKAVEAGNSKALAVLGFMHESGTGVPVDLVRALEFYKQAAAKGIQCKKQIARVHADIAADPALNAAMAAAAVVTASAAAAAAAAAEEERPAKRARPENESMETLQRERAALDGERKAMDVEKDCVRRWEAALKHWVGNVEDRERQLQHYVEDRERQLEQYEEDEEAESEAETQRLQESEAEATRRQLSLMKEQQEALVQQQLQWVADAKRQQQALVQQQEALAQQKQQWEAEAKQQELSLKRRQAAVRKREADVQEKQAEIERLKRERDEAQRIKEEAVAALIAVTRSAATSKQAEILAARRTEVKGYASTRDALNATWTRTMVDILYCQPCARRIEPGQSVLLDQCLHSICRSCVPHMLQPDGGSVVCPVCEVVSTLAPAALPHHPLVEAELAALDLHACTLCVHLPEDDRLSATVKCTSCEPSKLLCEAHSLHHRIRMPTHVLTPMPHSGAALRCSAHDKPIEAYCTHCSKLICLACALSTHPTATHNLTMLTDTATVESAKARLVAGVRNARTMAQALIDHASDATVAVTELDERDAVIAAEVDRAFNILVGLLEQRRATIHERCAAQSREERLTLQIAREKTEYRWRILTSAAELEAAATARLHAILELAFERSVPPPAILRFHFDESLAEQLAHLGEVVQDAP